MQRRVQAAERGEGQGGHAKRSGGSGKKIIIPKDIQQALKKHLTVMETSGIGGKKASGRQETTGSCSMAYLGDVMLSAEYVPKKDVEDEEEPSAREEGEAVVEESEEPTAAAEPGPSAPTRQDGISNEFGGDPRSDPPRDKAVF